MERRTFKAEVRKGAKTRREPDQPSKPMFPKNMVNPLIQDVDKFRAHVKYDVVENLPDRVLEGYGTYD